MKDYLGKWVVLYFYPKDNTETCTIEVCNLRDNYSKLRKLGFELLGVSADSQRKHKNFINKYNLPFPLLADVERNVIDKYGVWGEKKMMGHVFDGIYRTTFIIDKKGIITHIIDKVESKSHSEQIIELVSNN